MYQKSKSLWIKLLLLVTLVCCIFGVWFSLPASVKESKIAKADTVDVTDEVSITGASCEEIQSMVKINMSIGSAAVGTWYNKPDSLINANNGVDIMEYIYVNGQSTRALSDANASNNQYVGKSGTWAGNGYACAPVFVESAADGIWLTVVHAYTGGTSYTITLKEGFSILNPNGGISTISEDVEFAYNAGSVAKQTDVTDTVSIVNSSYGENQSQFVINLTPASALTSNAWWNINGSSLIAANNGVDIMNYIYINGQNIRTLSDDNRTNNTYPLGAGSGWLGNSDQCRPVFVESTSGGIYVTVLHALSGTKYTITLKAGFAMLNESGTMSTISEDVNFAYNAGSVAKQTDVTDTVSIVNSSYGENQSQFKIALNPASTLTSNAWWNINGSSLIAANNGVDIMNYIYINGQNIRTLSDDNRTNNTYPLGAGSGWLGNSDQCRPVFVESTSGGIYVTVLHSFSTTSYTITLKEGFAMLGVNGDALTISKDVNFAYNAGSVAKQTDVTDTVSIVNSSYGENQSQFKIALNPASTLTSNAWWNINGSSLIAANNGVDIMNYIYINGENIRTLSDDNRTNNTYPVDTAGGWLANSDQCRPVFVESTADGIYVTVLHAFSGTKYTITLKAGFAILNESGAMSTVTEDVNFMYNAGTVSGVQLYTLTFEGAGSKVVTADMAIGELPAVPEKDGYTAIGWEIDGVAITAETVYNYGANKTAVAVYEKVVDAIDVTDTIWFTQDDWMSGNPSDCITLSIRIYNESKTAWLYEYVVADPSIKGCWNDNGANYAVTNGVDIMEYLYFNGESARSIVTKNQQGVTSYVGTTEPLSIGSVFAPIAIETTGSFTTIKILNDWIPEDGFIITVKSGFELLLNDGNIITTMDDVSFKYADGALTKMQAYVLSFEGEGSKTVLNGEAIGALPAVPEKDGYVALGWAIDGVRISAETVYNYGADKTAVAVYAKDVTDTVSVTNASYKEAQSLFKIELIPSSALTSNAWWNINGASLIAANNGVDIMNYIYVNGQNVRTLSDNNRANNTYPVGDATGWLTNSDQCRPVFVETNGEGIYVTVLHAFSGENYKITLKAGFAILTSDGEVSTITEDVSFSYNKGTIVKVEEYTLTFDGAGSKVVTSGEAIGALPAVPENAGYVGYWAIDGVRISAETVYSYAGNKTAVAVYAKDVTDTVSITNESYKEAQSLFKIELIPSSALTSNGWWNIYGSNLIAANNGVDIMNYIYVNGENIRALSDNNRTNNTYPVGSATGWLTNSDQCRPVFVETNGEGIYVTVLHAFSGESYTVTLKAGFTILTADGETSTITEDIDFAVTASGVTKIQEYVLSFEGTDETVTVIGGSAIGALPVLPEVEGKIVLGWAIDGVKIDESTVYNYGANKTATILYAEEYTLSFEGLDDTLTVFSGMVIGDLPEVPANAGYVGYWTIDGVRISSTSLYNFTEDKTAVAVYAKDITNIFSLEYRDWGSGDDYTAFGILVDGAYLVARTDLQKYWNDNAATLVPLNGGCDIMDYIYIKEKSARALVTENQSSRIYKGSEAPFSYGGVYAPVLVETAAEGAAGLWIKVLNAYAGDYFEITIKAGFSLIDSEGTIVYLSKDVNYKYIVNDDATVTFGKGVLTDEELDELGGNPITLRNGNETYLEKSTVRLTLPALDSVIVEDGLSQVFVGWTTDLENLSNLYPAGYKYEPTSETGTTLHAVWIGFEMQNGAAVRLSVDSSGLRFLTDIDRDAYNKLGVEEGLILEVGTFVVPTDYLYFGADPVHSSFSKGQYVEKKTDIWKVQDEAESVWTYAAAFVNISETQFSRSFSARGYLKINYTSGEGYIYTPYSEENNARSIYQVAAAAYDDYSTNALIQNYVNKVAEITWDEEHNFSATTGVKGNYEVVSISADGETFTVTIDGDVKSLLINGSRLAIGNGAHVAIGNFVYKFSGLTAVDGGYQFTVGAADELVGKVEDETLYFNSSDIDLDFFLNDFFKRHSGYTDENGYNMKVNSTTAGVNSEEFFSHEWMSMAYYWYNSDDGYAEDRIAGLREFLSTVPVDDYGYVWTSNDNVLPNDAEYDDTIHRMGWPIPHAYTTRTAAWEFNGGTESWTSNVSAASSDNLLTANVSGQSANITFSSPSNFYSVDGTIFTRKRVHTERAPLMQIDIRIDDATNVEDIYVWYTTSASTSFTEDKKVSVKDKAFLSYDIGNTTGAYNHLLFLPMYAETAWGESSSTYVYQIKIEIALKSGTTISGNVGLNSVRLLADTRQSNNNSILISSLRQDYDYTGDLDFLADNITRARKAMNFLMQMYDPDRKLNLQSYLVGHDGDKSGSAAYLKTSGSISNGYWDVTFMPEYDFQSNMYFYKAVADMAYLEGILEANGISVDKAGATVKTATRSQTYGTSEYTYTADSLNTVASDVLSAMRANVSSGTAGGFWNATTGRFAAGYGANGNLYDYGYVAWNLEAIYYGIATDEQAEKIMAWLNSEEALYDFVFAPRSNTVADKEMLNGQWDANDNEWGFGDNVQYGGATMYTSFYDLMARIEYLGTDNAYERLQAIQAWYKEVYDCYMATEGANPNEFYRYYYAEKGITLQGAGTSGGLGLDAEFLESYLPLSSVAYGFFGINSIDGKTLKIAPTLPTDLTYWGMENLAFNFVEYDLIAYKNGVQISSVRGDTAGLKLQIVLDYTAGQNVYVNGVKVSNPVTENGKVYVTVDMGATVVEVK